MTAVSLREILTADVFRDHRLYAGRNGLDHLVRRITVSDIPDALEWLAGGELVCTTGYILSKNPEAQESWLMTAAGRGAAAIVIKPDRFLGLIPPQMVDVADKLDLPLIGIPNNIIWPTVIQETMDIMLSKQVQQLKNTYDIHHHLEEVVLSSAGLEAILDTLSEIVGCFVSLEDEFFNPIAACTKYEADGDSLGRAKQQRIKSVGSTSADKPREWIIAAAEKDVEGNQVIMPVIAGKHNFGWLIAFPVPHENVDFVRNALEHGATAVALEQLGHLASIQNRTEQINQFFRSMLTGKGLTRSEIARYGQEWGINLSAPTMVILFHCKPNLSMNVFRSCIDTMKQFDPSSLLSVHDFTMYMLFHPKSKSVPAIKAECGRLCYRILSICEAGNYSCHIGIGELFSIFDGAQFRRSYKEAEICVARAQETGETILFYTDIGIARLFPFLNDSEGVVSMAEGLLAPLTASDETLVSTLRTYIASGFSKTKAAKELCIHVNTMNYRLEKIQDLLNVDLSDVDTYLLLYTATEILTAFRHLDENIPDDTAF